MSREIERHELHGKWVFLSASYPAPERSCVYAEKADVRAISNAVVELARAVFDAGGSLVFGGHPTISPLVLRIAESAEEPPGENGAPRVRVYQSAVFSGVEAEASKRIGQLRIGQQIATESVSGEHPIFRNGALAPESVTKSLDRMRRRMIEDNKPVAAVFIGGMEGVEDEYRIVAEYPDVRRYLVAGPGGAARILAEQGNPVAPDDAVEDLTEALGHSQLFPWRMRSLVADMGAQAAGQGSVS